MVKRVLLLALMVLAAACASPAELGPTEGQATDIVEEKLVLATSTNGPELIEPEPPKPTETEVLAQPEDECPGEERNIIGQGIADEYEFASYEQVMAWFCNGAEFEDILVALQTEEQSGTPAEEMLVWLAEGFTWEEIWLVVGLTE
jgi:hypothetical protein